MLSFNHIIDAKKQKKGRIIVMKEKNLFDLNMNEKLRLEILGYKPEWVDYSEGGLYGYFEDGVEVDLDALRKLIEKNFILRDEYTLGGYPYDYEGEHCDATGLCIDDFVRFMEKWNSYNLKLIAYLVSPDRHDYRISPRGLIVKSKYFDNDNTFRNDFYNTVFATSFAHYYERRGIRGCYWFD